MRWELPAYFCEMCGLAVWIGGFSIILVVVIPAVFNSFGMEPAGRFLRRVFDGYGQVTVGVLILLSLNLAIKTWLAHRGTTVMFPVTKLEYLLVGSMAVVTVLILWVFGPQAIALQEAAFQAATDVEKRTAYDRFFQLHMVVRALHLINVGLAIGLFILKLRYRIAMPVRRAEEPPST